jgi:hypothetical protein
MEKQDKKIERPSSISITTLILLIVSTLSFIGTFIENYDSDQFYIILVISLYYMMTAILLRSMKKIGFYMLIIAVLFSLFDGIVLDLFYRHKFSFDPLAILLLFILAITIKYRHLLH